MRTIRDKISDDGYVFFEKYNTESDLVTVAEAVGRPFAASADSLVQQLVARIDSPPNTYGGIYGNGIFPFHTDLAHWRLPPRYLILRCVCGFADVFTYITDGRGLIDSVSLDILSRAVFKPRRPQNGSISLLRLCERQEEGYRLRWDEVFIQPASSIGDVAFSQVKRWLLDCGRLSIPLSAKGDTLIIDNWRMLHSRSPILKGREGRIIHRIYLEDLK